ncbi:MAG TPA: radical SAM protein [Vicinamibacterales bacterium]|nr:radical SAM protein [Vicinamibacterales bacterium]
MSDTAALFDLGPQRPTTRTIALQVRERGAASLDQAQRRADEARYQEITCRSALNRVQGMPFKWTLNPYRGCTHGCHYCFARRYQTQFELGPDDEFSSLIFVKVNFADVLRRELDRPAWTRDLVALGTATDPYQPIEGHYKLSRRTLEALVAGRTPVGIVTKGPMIVRDIDLLSELTAVASCSVCISVPTVDENAWRTLEPGTAHPLQRLRAVKRLREAGIHAGVLMAPVVPGFTTQRAKLEATIKAAADHDAAFVGANLLYLKEGTRDHFMGFIAREHPQMLSRYQRLYPGAYARPEYAATARALIHTLEATYGVGRRHVDPPETHDSDATSGAEVAAQKYFEW